MAILDYNFSDGKVPSGLSRTLTFSPPSLWSYSESLRQLYVTEESQLVHFGNDHSMLILDDITELQEIDLSYDFSFIKGRIYDYYIGFGSFISDDELQGHEFIRLRKETGKTSSWGLFEYEPSGNGYVSLEGLTVGYLPEMVEGQIYEIRVKRSSTGFVEFLIDGQVSCSYQQKSSLLTKVFLRNLSMTSIFNSLTINKGFPDINSLVLNLNKPIWSNKETVSQANDYPYQVQNLIDKQAGKMAYNLNGYSSQFDSQGNSKLLGYYQSTVLIDKVPSSQKKVLCFTNSGHLVAETISNSEGEYRFDYLDLNRRYMFVAQYSNEVNTPPDYAAVAADWQTPIPYKE